MALRIDPIAEHKRQELRNASGVAELEDEQGPDWHELAREKRRAAREARQKGPAVGEQLPSPLANKQAKKPLSEDVFDILGIAKSDEQQKLESAAVAARAAQRGKPPSRASARTRQTFSFYPAGEGGYDLAEVARFGREPSASSTGTTIAGPQMCVAARWSSNDEMLATGYFDGEIHLYDVKRRELLCQKVLGDLWTDDAGSWLDTSDLARLSDEAQVSARAGYRPVPGYSSFAVTNLRWCPSGNARIPSGILAGTGTDGLLGLWEVASLPGNQRTLRLKSAITAPDEYYGLDWSCDGQRLVAGGRGRALHLYTGELQEVTMPWREDQHSNRIIAVKCHPHNPALVFSGGFDKTVQVWDIRTGDRVRVLSGPLIDGDCLDIDASGNYILAGSSQQEPQLSVIDWRSERTLHKWNIKGTGEMSTTCAQFSRDAGGLYIHTAGVGAEDTIAQSFKCPPFGDGSTPARVASVTREQGCSGLFRCMEGSRDSQIAYGSSDGTLLICELRKIA